MQDVFTTVGLVCAILVCGTIFVLALARYNNNEAENYYNGLRDQLTDTRIAIGEQYQKHEPISAGSVMLVLSMLNARRTPNLYDIKANDEHVLKGPNLK